MSLTQEQFDQIVERLEREASSHPTRYRAKVALWAGLGYAFIGLLLLIAIGIVVFLLLLLLLTGKGIVLLFKFGWIAVVFLYLVIRSLWISFPKPEGVVLPLQEYPQLSTMIHGLEQSLKTPKFHRVLLTPEFNASVYQRPRLGIFGWQQNHLMLGLPLMCVLTPEQVRAVVAHEFGHLSGNHGRFGGWIYRLRSTWRFLLESAESHGGRGESVIERFFHWYIPRFNALTFALARSDEYIADACAAQLVGPEHFTRALINVEVIGRWYSEQFWDTYFKRCDEFKNPYVQMNRDLRHSVDPSTANQFLEQSLSRSTDTIDTHPSLSDRLKAIGSIEYLNNHKEGSDPLLPSQHEETAADYYFGDRLDWLAQELIDALDWDAEAAFAEYELHRQVSLEELEQLEEKAQSETLDEEETFRLIRLKYELEDYEKAMPYLKQALQDNPDQLEANFLMGAIMLKHYKDSTGIHYIEKVMSEDLESIPSGCHLIYEFLMERGRKEEAQRYRHRAVDYLNQVEEARKERELIDVRDRLLPHQLPASEVDSLREQLMKIPDIKSVFLVQKEAKYFTEEPIYLLGVRLKFRLSLRRNRLDSVIERIMEIDDFPNTMHILILEGRNPIFEKKFRQVPGSRIVG